jgi:uncharacterized protein (TIGR03435 family)
MMRTLLAERLNFKGHIETREALADSLASGTPSPFLGRIRARPGAACSVRSGGNLIEGDAPIATMPLMIRMMAGGPVFDKTGLNGSYRIRLEAAPRRPPGLESATPGISDPPDIFTALPEQLGLKLEPSKTTVNVLIVDHIDRPTENSYQPERERIAEPRPGTRSPAVRPACWPGEGCSTFEIRPVSASLR